MQDPESSKRHVLEKFKKKGLHHLTLEELAITQISPNWSEEFKAATNEDWSTYQEKVSDRLSRAKFNLKWLSREQSSSFSNLFSVVLRGDLKMLEDYIRINDLKACKQAVDDSKKTCLHIACREGHSDIVEYLVNHGWSLEARDKLLSTPLHLACTSGHSHITAFLLLKGADPRARDSLGRNSLLFAVCSQSTETVEVLLKKDPSLIESKDYSGRSALHFAVFNPHQRQVDILRTLLEAGIPVDVPDTEMKTPMHHACEASKPRGIRLLIKWGANLSAQDKTGKTPYDLASNPNIKQLVSLYSKTKAEDAKASRLSSEKLPMIKTKVSENRQNTPVMPASAGENQSQIFGQSQVGFKEKLLALLRKVQETGVQANQHIKKPSLYSGSWVEGVLTTAALHNELSSVPSSEAVIKVFNVLFPYPKTLPSPQEDEMAGLDFFGPGTYKTPRQEAIYIQDDGKVIRLQNQLDSAEQNIRDLQQMLMGKDSIIQELQNALKGKSNELMISQELVHDLRDKLADALRQAPTVEEVRAREMEKQRLIETIKSLQVKLEEGEKRAKDLKGLSESLKVELEARPNRSEVEALKESIKILQADDRNLRFKAGQIFLSALESEDLEDSAAPQGHLQDDEVLKRLERALSNNPPSFKQRLVDADGNKDGKVTKGELAKVVGTLMLPPQDIIVLLRISGFRKGVANVSIESISTIYSSREQRKENLENLLFGKLVECFAKSNMTIDQAFDYLDVNDDGLINFQELSSVCETLHLNLNREDRHALFAVLDSDHNGTISLEELKSRLESAPQLPKQARVSRTSLSGIAARLPNSRYDEGKDPTPASSVIEEPADLKTNPQKPSKPLESKTRTDPQEKSKTVKRLSGSLVVGLVRGKGLGPGSIFCQVRIEGAEKSLKTPALQGPDPDWKYKGRLRLYDTSTTLVGTEVVVEVFNDKGLQGAAHAGWTSTLDFPNSWAVKSEFPVQEPNGRKKGSVFVHLMWCPKDSVRVEGAGVLSVQVESFAGFPKALLQFSISDLNVFTPLEKQAVTLIKDLTLKPNEPVPSLKCSILNASTRELILWRNLSIEVSLAQKGWTNALSVPLNGGYSLALKFLWTPQTAEEENRLKAVIKIQAMFRGMKARKDLPLMRKKSRVLAKKVLKRDKDYFFVSLLGRDDDFLLQLHEVSNELPMYEVISELPVQKQPVNELLENLSVNEAKEIVLQSVLPETTGSLGIEIVSCSTSFKCFTRIEHGKEYVHTKAGPPWGMKVMMPAITFSQFKPLKFTVISVEKREEVAMGLVDWQEALKNNEKWTNEKIFDIGKISACLKFFWTGKKQPQVVQLEKVEEGIKKKSVKKLVGRKGICRNKKYFLLSLFETAGIVEIQLHSASDPKVPMYQVIDSVSLRPGQDLQKVIQTLQVSRDNKLIIEKGF
jgi:ankyrin repeat protein/Ca2+-binding EF-hand superfamily protein